MTKKPKKHAEQESAHESGTEQKTKKNTIP